MNNKKPNLIYVIFIAIMLIMIIYILLTHSKVTAAQELLAKTERIQELEQLILDAQDSYAIAEDSKNECITSRNEQKELAHKQAEEYRAEIKELQGFLLGR